jgi:prepilin signal peptidase PulO-like enzyme (type II secretory pathway)
MAMDKMLMAALVFIIFSFFLSFKDIMTGRVSRFLLWGAISCSFLLQYGIGGRNILFNAVSGCILGLGVFFLVFLVSGKRLGLADVWYAGLAGSVLGPVWWYPAMGLACVLAVVYMLASRRRSVPFIPFMAAGSVCIIPAAWFAAAGSG